MDRHQKDLPEIWGGLECTINRIGEKFIDQLDLSNFYKQPDHLDEILSLGVKALRYPVLWEKHQSTISTIPDFSRAICDLNKLKAADVEPIVGLLHHGSGPRFTDLLDDKFPFLFASYAGEVARAMPWVNMYTPVNEPLTTARFSGLYSHWYPHKHDDGSFVRILLNELKATVLAMQEIRKVNPKAKLLQTEDLGKTYSTPLLKYQADFENERRWLTYDLLCGKITKEHSLYYYLSKHSGGSSSLDFFIENPCPPEIVGINHYLTSERFLDEEVQHYPADKIGANNFQQYADVEAARVQLKEPHGAEHLFEEMWVRYKIPMVISEVHLHCTRDEQLRWLKYIYDITVSLKRKGADIKAITAWALTGSFGWNSLLTHWPGNYECGAFDISAGRIRPTAVASMIKKLGTGCAPGGNVLHTKGWWASSDRFFKQCESWIDSNNNYLEKPLVITGKSGTLGRALAAICKTRNIPFLLTGREELNLSSVSSIKNIVSVHKPWAIINAAGYVKLDQAEHERSLCHLGNYTGVKNLAGICNQYNVKLVTFSTDQVFDGIKETPYTEEDETCPLNQYGISKQLAEKFLMSALPGALIIRTAAFFGPWDQYNFAHQCLWQLSKGKRFYASNQHFISPTYVPHLAHAALDLLIDEARGIYHLTNKGCETWFSFAEKLADKFGFDKDLIQPGTDESAPARRPCFAAMESTKYGLMPTLDAALNEYKQAVHALFDKPRKKNTLYERI